MKHTVTLLTIAILAPAPVSLTAADAPSNFDRKNISALWIADPWDAKKRGPEERMQMLQDSLRLEPQHLWSSMDALYLELIFRLYPSLP